jgi:hypothetical protein
VDHAGVNPRAEAFDRIGGTHEVRVLEPSPPAVAEAPFFADDPVATDGAPPGRPVVSPVSGADVRWYELCEGLGDAALTQWCAARWLGPWRDLEPAPAGLVAARDAWHAVAEWVVAPARHAANGRIGLRWTRGGVGTPFFGDHVQVRIEGTDLVVVRQGALTRASLTSLGDAATVAGVPHASSTGVYEPATVWDAARPVAVDAAPAAFLGDWYGFAVSVLEELRAGAGPTTSPSRVQLWPEHFDLAVELGDDSAGRRANYGASPGDETHPEPYLYVGPWGDARPGEREYWNEGFGASMSYNRLLDGGDHRESALAFFRHGLEVLGDGRA